ncbi:28S ribosomal protein S9, mitochondrial [Venturia canescens]|uniref:28S ribosomal protein S9, mitochondrial n=1 Tax=Venturia canescens TaxID=32260 RepID=UPI001C9C9189|nr:28S ribosomal protein S9, mitochondrial [Venturia canescens]
MAVSASAGLLSRLTNARNAVRNINNLANITPKFTLSSSFVTRKYSLNINAIIDTGVDTSKPKKKVSKAMRAYLERAQEYDMFMKKEATEYEIGKRHLANMMGENPENFTQEDVTKSIQYLFPSGLYDKKARPIMEPPEKMFPSRKAAEFDETGRPYHTLFYTCKPNYNQLLHDIVTNLNNLNDVEDQSIKKGLMPRPEDAIQLTNSEWKTKPDLETFLLEVLNDGEYDKFIAAADRLAEHPYSFQVKDFIMKVRNYKLLQSEAFTALELQYTPDGRPFVTVKECRRKSARADVTVIGNGTGKITINGEDLTYFSDIQSREQVSPIKILTVNLEGAYMREEDYSPQDEDNSTGRAIEF